jgi:hypothetical protein
MEHGRDAGIRSRSSCMKLAAALPIKNIFQLIREDLVFFLSVFEKYCGFSS